MNIKSLRTNYKIYGIIIGVILATVIYNIIPMDFYFDFKIIEKNPDFIESLIYVLTLNLKTTIIIIFITFIRKKDICLTIFLGWHSFKLTANLVIIIKTVSLNYISGILENLFFIVLILLLMRNENVKQNIIIGLAYVLVATFLENIILFFL